jgi:hypothetical protein
MGFQKLRANFVADFGHVRIRLELNDLENQRAR